MANPSPKVVPIKTPATSGLIAEIARLKAYIHAIDPPKEPITETSRNEIFKTGVIPGWILVKIMALVKERDHVETT
jgi:hypothetical protein